MLINIKYVFKLNQNLIYIKRRYIDLILKCVRLTKYVNYKNL